MSYEELIGSPQENIQAAQMPDGRYQFLRRLKVPWDQRHLVAEELWDTPYPYYIPNEQELYPTRIRIQPYTDGTNTQPPDVVTHALLEVDYGVGFHRFWEEWSCSVEFWTVTYIKAWVNGVPQYGQLPMRGPLLHYIYWDCSGNPPPTQAITALGALNDLPFVPVGGPIVLPPLKVMYSRFEARNRWHGAGWHWRAEFTYRPRGWHSIYDGARNIWQPALNADGNLVMPYSVVDLNTVIGSDTGQAYPATVQVQAPARLDMEGLYSQHGKYNVLPLYQHQADENNPLKRQIRYRGDKWEIGVASSTQWTPVWYGRHEWQVTGDYTGYQQVDGNATVQAV